MNKAIFLDRDGVINQDKGYIHKIEDFALIPGVIEALNKFQNAGYILFIITNQSGIGRGYYPIEDFLNVNEYMLALFKRQGIKIEKVYFCPHRPEDNCECRKPKTKLIEQAIGEFDIDRKASWMIGDKIKDIEMGRNAGLNAVLLKSRYNQDSDETKHKNLLLSSKFILKKS